MDILPPLTMATMSISPPSVVTRRCRSGADTLFLLWLRGYAHEVTAIPEASSNAAINLVMRCGFGLALSMFADQQINRK